MKKGCYLILLILLLAPCTSAARGHRIGVGLGSASGSYEQSGEKIDLKGELLELPLYYYVANNGLMVGFRLMEFSVKGETISSLERTEFAFKQSLLGASLGVEIKIGNNVVIAPQIVKSYLGSNRFSYSTYTTYTGYLPDYPYEYVTDTDTITGSADLSGWEIPVYWVGKFFYFGVKLCAYTSKTEIKMPSGPVNELSITGAISMVLEARF